MYALRSRFTRLAFAFALFISSGTLYGATAYGQESTIGGSIDETAEGTPEDEAGFSSSGLCPARIWCVTHNRHEIIYVPC